MSLITLDDIIGAEKKQKVNWAKAIKDRNIAQLEKILTDAKITIRDLLKEGILLQAAASGDVSLLQSVLEFVDYENYELQAVDIPATVIDAVFLSADPASVDYMLSFKDSTNDAIALEQIAVDTLITAAMAGPQFLKKLLQWTDKRGRGFTVHDILNSNLLDYLTLRKDEVSLKYIFEKFKDYTGKRVSPASLNRNLQMIFVDKNPTAVFGLREPKYQSRALRQMVELANVERDGPSRKALISNLAQILDVHREELSTAIGETVAERIGKMYIKKRKAHLSPSKETVPERKEEVPNYVHFGKETKPVESKQAETSVISEMLRVLEEKKVVDQQQPKEIEEKEEETIKLSHTEFNKILQTAAKAAANDALKAGSKLLREKLGSLSSTEAAQLISTLNPREVEQNKLFKAVREADSSGPSFQLKPKVIGTALTERDYHIPIPILTGHALQPQKLKTEMPDGPKIMLDMFIKDLKTFQPGEIKIMAKYMGMNPQQGTSHLCGEIGHKLMLIHTDALPETDKGKCERYAKKLQPEDLNKIRTKIYKQFEKFANSVTEMTSNDLQEFFRAYDEACFDGDIQKYMQEMNFTLKFKTAGEKTFTTEGICTGTSCNYTITIPIEPFARVNGVTNVAGHPCKDQLECLQRVVEHELTHLVIFMLCGDPFVKDQHGELFMRMVSDLFGHTDHRHYIF